VSGFRGGVVEPYEHMSNVYLYQFCTPKLIYIYIYIYEEFLATDTEVPSSIPGATRFSE